MKKKLEKGQVWLCFDQCEVHGFTAISINGNNGGTRITSGKCCGAWKTIRRWKMDGKKLSDAVKSAVDVEMT